MLLSFGQVSHWLLVGGKVEEVTDIFCNGVVSVVGGNFPSGRVVVVVAVDEAVRGLRMPRSRLFSASFHLPVSCC